jgi:hypothetical protein
MPNASFKKSRKWEIGKEFKNENIPKMSSMKIKQSLLK